MRTQIKVKCEKRFGLFYYKAYWRGIEITSALSEAYAYTQAYQLLYKRGLIKPV